jgi:hypothetical protein
MKSVMHPLKTRSAPLAMAPDKIRSKLSEKEPVFLNKWIMKNKNSAHMSQNNFVGSMMPQLIPKLQI